MRIAILESFMISSGRNKYCKRTLNEKKEVSKELCECFDLLQKQNEMLIFDVLGQVQTDCVLRSEFCEDTKGWNSMSVSFQPALQDDSDTTSGAHFILGDFNSLFPAEDSIFFSSSVPQTEGVQDIIQAHPDLSVWSLAFGSIHLSSYRVLPLVQTSPSTVKV